MINRRIITSLMILGIVGALAGGSTWALLNDTETSDTNTFQAGPMELNLDMESRLNGETLGEEEIAEGQPFARMDDVKPGDVAEEEVEVEVEGNPAFVEMRLNETEDADNSCTEPEQEAEGGECDDQGELRENTHLTVWNDANGNGEIDGDEEPMFENPSHNSDVIEEGLMLDADPSTEEIEPFQDDSQTIVYRWEVPRDLGNEAQTDSFAYDLQLRAEQARHNGPENAADWYQVTGEDAGEPVDQDDEQESNETEEDTNETDNNQTDDQQNESEDDTSSSDTSGFSDNEESDTNEFEAESDDSEANESEGDAQSSNTQQQDREEQDDSEETTDDTNEENNSSTGQATAGVTGLAGVLLVLFIGASALYRRRL